METLELSPKRKTGIFTTAISPGSWGSWMLYFISENLITGSARELKKVTLSYLIKFEYYLWVVKI